jgi:hypothetical protein
MPIMMPAIRAPGFELSDAATVTATVVEVVVVVVFLIVVVRGFVVVDVGVVLVVVVVVVVRSKHWPAKQTPGSVPSKQEVPSSRFDPGTHNVFKQNPICLHPSEMHGTPFPAVTQDSTTPALVLTVDVVLVVDIVVLMARQEPRKHCPDGTRPDEHAAPSGDRGPAKHAC